MSKMAWLLIYNRLWWRLVLFIAGGCAVGDPPDDEPQPRETEDNTSSIVSFLECEGPAFDPSWAVFKRELTARMARGSRPGEALANRAADLLDVVEGEDLSQKVAAFAALLRGDVHASDVLGGFCLYGAVAAYACVAMHLASYHDESGLPPSAKSSVARALLLLAKKQGNDFMESTNWFVRSMDLVAMIESEDVDAVRELPRSFQLPCAFALGCQATREQAEKSMAPPPPPLSAAWPETVAAIGMHITSTLEVVTALRDAVNEAWGRGGAAGAPFEVQYAGHPCPSHEGSEHQCAMKCEMLGQCGASAEASDPLAEFLIGAVDVARYEEREAYSLTEARAALRWVPRRLAPLRQADMLVCTFPTVLCVLVHELFPSKPMLFVAIANPLFAAPGCIRQEDSTVRECQTEEAQEYLVALRSLLTESAGIVQGVAAYSVTTALVGFQAGVQLPLAGKAGRYLPAAASWRLERHRQVLLARSRFFDTAFGSNLRTIITGFKHMLQSPIDFVLQQEVAAFLSYEDISRFRAVVILPQDLGLHKFTEHYAMAMPIWMPSRELAYRLQMFVPWGMVSYSGTWRGDMYRGADNDEPSPEATHRLQPPTKDWALGDPNAFPHPPWFNAQTVPYQLVKVAFWYEFSEFVAYPGVQAFDSIPALIAESSTADLHDISASMRRFRAELWQTTRAVYAAAASRLAASRVKGMSQSDGSDATTE